MQRTILIVLVGTILGILWGLYFKSITLIFLIILFFYYIVSLNINFRKKTRRYIKLIINKKFLIIIFISFIISNVYFNIRNNEYERKYSLLQKSTFVIGKIVSSGEEKKYVTKYILELRQIDETKINSKLYVNAFFKKGTSLKYGSVLKITCNVNGLDKSRNYGGFNSYEYGKITSSLGNIQVEKYKHLKEEKSIDNLAFNIKLSIENKIKTFLPEASGNILLGIILGEKQNLTNSDIENFRNSSLIHMLCVSRSTCVIYYARTTNNAVKN